MEPRVSGVWGTFGLSCSVDFAPKGCTRGFFVAASVLEVSLDGPRYLRQIRVLVTNPGLRKRSPFGSRLGNTDTRIHCLSKKKGRKAAEG